MLPRSPQVGDDDDDDDGPDPFTDNDGTDSDGYDTPVPPTDNDNFDTPPPPTDNDGTDSDGFNTPPPTDNDGEDTPIPLDERSISGPQTRSWTVRSGDTLSQIAEYLGVPLDVLTAQTKDRGMIYPGQKFYYVSERQMDTPPPFTDNDGTDSGYDTPPPESNGQQQQQLAAATATAGSLY